MAGDSRRHRSKWDTKEGPPDAVGINEDKSPWNKDINCKGGDALPKPDASMHRGSGGHEQQNHEGVNKDMKEIQSKASSERSQPSKLADEHDDKGWGNAVLEKPHGNQGMDRYADDRRRGDGWGTALNRGYSSRMPSDADAWRQHSRSPSPRGVWNRSRRNRSRSRSRSRNRSRSRSRGRGRGRSRSPYFVDRGPEWRTERGRTSGGSLPCRDFIAGRCRRGLNCRFPHEDGGHRPLEEHYPAGPRERYGHQSKEFMGSREQGGFLQSRQSRGRYDDETWERSEPQRDYRSTEQCYNFAKGRCSRGASCRFAHDDPAPHGGWRDEARQSAYDRVGPDSAYGNRIEHRRVNKNPCKFFAAGQCRRGANCPYLHEEASLSQMGLSAPDEPSNYNDGPTGRGNFSNWGEPINAAHATSQIVSRDDTENPVSQSVSRDGSRYEYENNHPKDAGKSQYQITPQEDFGSQVHKSEVVALQQPSLLTPVQTSADSMNNDKVSDTYGHSAPGTAVNLIMHTGMHAGNVAENLGQIVQSQDAISQICGPPTLPVTTQLQDNTSSLPSNSQMQQSNFSVHPQEQFLLTQAAVNTSTHNVHGQQVAPHMGHGQFGYGLVTQALPNLSAHNGHNFGAAGQVPQDRPTSVHTAQSQAAIDLPRPGQDSGAQAQSIQNMQSFQPVAPNGQTQNQSLQGFSLLPASNSGDMVGVSASHIAPKSEDIQRVTASLAQYFGNAGLSAGAVGLQSSEPNMNTRSMVSSSAAPPPAVQPSPWPWAQQHAGMVQPALSVPSDQQQQAPQTFQTPMAVGSGNGYITPLPHSGASAVQAAASVINETTPPEDKKGETKDTDAEANEDGGEKNKSKGSKALKMFKIALADFVKEALKPTWKEGQLSREVHKTIVKKVVDKVTGTVENIPPTKEKVEIYMSFSKDKLNKLVQAYVGKYANAQ